MEPAAHGDTVDAHAIWIAACARRLRERFPRVALPTLEETAEQLLAHPRLQGLDGAEAAARWLSLSR